MKPSGEEATVKPLESSNDDFAKVETSVCNSGDGEAVFAYKIDTTEPQQDEISEMSDSAESIISCCTEVTVG